MNSNLDIWAIQYYPEELINAINKINGGLNIIYSNVKCDLTIGSEKVISRQFDTILYNEESDILIMLSRDGLVKKEDMIKYLENNNKRYIEISFNYEIFDYKEKDNVPELWFAREKYVLEEALQDSLNKDIDTCKFYPYISSKLKLGFLSKNYDYLNLDKIYFKGLIKLEDKIILIMNQKNNIDEFKNSRNMGLFKVLETLDRFGIECKLYDDKETNIYQRNFSKKLSLRKKDY